ncbi:hypothetical protein pb186bvf_012785 [Paramecium bursaria]
MIRNNCVKHKIGLFEEQNRGFYSLLIFLKFYNKLLIQKINNYNETYYMIIAWIVFLYYLTNQQFLL